MGKEPESQFGLIILKLMEKSFERFILPPGWFWKLITIYLYKSIRENAPVMESPENGYNVIRIIELAFESSEKQCRVEVSGLL